MLGGDANPLGAVVHYLHTTPDAVIAALGERFIRTSLDEDLIPALPALLPFEAPWSRILVAPVASGRRS